MSFKYSFTDYPVAGVSKLLATYGGAHILNVEVPEDEEFWNGKLVCAGAMKSFDLYEAESADAETVDMEIVAKAANGNYYVQVNEDTDVLLVYNPPVVEAEFTKDAASEKHFYLAAGEVGRCHCLKKWDVFELSADGFSGTPGVGATITSISGGKPVATGVSV